MDSKLLAINILASDKLEDVKALVESEGILYPVLTDESGDISNQYGIRSIPTIVIINKDGIVTDHHVGAYTKDQLLKLLEAGRQ